MGSFLDSPFHAPGTHILGSLIDGRVTPQDAKELLDIAVEGNFREHFVLGAVPAMCSAVEELVRGNPSPEALQSIGIVLMEAVHKFSLTLRNPTGNPGILNLSCIGSAILGLGGALRKAGCDSEALRMLDINNSIVDALSQRDTAPLKMPPPTSAHIWLSEV